MSKHVRSEPPSLPGHLPQPRGLDGFYGKGLTNWRSHHLQQNRGAPARGGGGCAIPELDGSSPMALLLVLFMAWSTLVLLKGLFSSEPETGNEPALEHATATCWSDCRIWRSGEVATAIVARDIHGGVTIVKERNQAAYHGTMKSFTLLKLTPKPKVFFDYEGAAQFAWFAVSNTGSVDATNIHVSDIVHNKKFLRFRTVNRVKRDG